MKKIISTVLIGATTSLMAMYSEQAYLYKDNRIMGAGGANTSVGGYSTSIFYNPAGLRDIKKEHGFVVDLLGLQIDGSEKFKDFVDDLTDAMDTEEDETAALVEVAQKYNGEHYHANISNYSAISKNSDIFAWSVGLLVGADINYMTHSDGSSNGSSLETTSRGYGGIFLGIAKDFKTDFGKFDVGVSGKFIQQKSYEGNIPIDELATSDDLMTYLEDNYEQKSSGFGIDVGVIYHPVPKNYWRPAIGLSLLNIGDMSMDDYYGTQPMTLNVGASVSPQISFLSKFVIAADLVDILNANDATYYDYNNKKITVSNEDFEKKIRAGITAGLIDSSWFSLELSGGFYQSSYTAGLNMEATILKISAATYEENIGYGSVDIKDRRYSLQLGIGW